MNTVKIRIKKQAEYPFLNIGNIELKTKNITFYGTISENYNTNKTDFWLTKFYNKNNNRHYAVKLPKTEFNKFSEGLQFAKNHIIKRSRIKTFNEIF